MLKTGILGVLSIIAAVALPTASADEVKSFIVQNPDGLSAIYVDSQKIAEGYDLKMPERFGFSVNAAGNIEAAKSDPKPLPLPDPPTTPKPSKCGDMPCPDPNAPKPDKPGVCHGPFCPGGVSFLSGDKKTMLYQNSIGREFPTRFDPNSFPRDLKRQLLITPQR